MRHLRQASEALGKVGFEREWEAAATVDFDDAVRVGLEEAARLIGQDSQSGPHPVPDNVIGAVPAADDAQLIAAGLTRREAEVFHLLAAGCSNKEIAGQLVLSLRTVENHLTHVYAKLGVRTRVEAVLLATRTINRPGR